MRKTKKQKKAKKRATKKHVAKRLRKAPKRAVRVQEKPNKSMIYAVSAIVVFIIIVAAIYLNHSSNPSSPSSANNAIAPSTPNAQIITLTLYYDSLCKFCGGKSVIEDLDKVNADLKDKGVQIKAVDTKGNFSGLKKLGIISVPVIVFPNNSLSNIAVQSMARKLQMENLSGLIVGYFTTRELFSPSCSDNNSAKLMFFYSESDPYSIRINNSSPHITAEEALTNVSKVFANKLNIVKECLSIRPGDEKKCKEAVGSSAYASAQVLKQQYHIRWVPTYVIDCKYIFASLSPTAIEKAVCSARPDVCNSMDISVS